MRFRFPSIVLVLASLLAGCGAADSRLSVRIPTGAGGVGFLPLLIMREHALIEKHAAAAGVTDLEVEWLEKHNFPIWISRNGRAVDARGGQPGSGDH